MSQQQLTSARDGDSVAFAAIVRSYQRLVFSLALRMLGSREQAEDLAQEVFLRLHDHLRGIQSPEHLAAWLRRVTANRAIDRLRQPGLPTTPLQDAPEVPTEPIEEDLLLRRELQRSMQCLAPAARAVVLLRYQEDLDPTEIARTLELPLNTVKSHLKRSLAVLRERLAPAVTE